MAWQFVLSTDEFSSPPVTNIGELLHATDRRLSFRLNRPVDAGVQGARGVDASFRSARRVFVR